MNITAIRLQFAALAHTVANVLGVVPKAVSAFTSTTPIEHFEQRLQALTTELHEEAEKALAKRDTLEAAIDGLYDRMYEHGSRARALRSLARGVGQNI